MEYTYLFLDTQFFDANAYDFENKHFKQILALADAGLICLLMPEVTQREIERHIAAKSKEAFTSLEKFRRGGFHKNLRVPPFDALAKGTTEEAIRTELMAHFKDFCSRAGVEHLPAKGLDISSILDDYFGEKPPFGSGKKKSEFPDAFTARILLNWCKAHSEKAVVVSGDGDWAGISDPRLEVLDTIAKFLDRFPDPIVANTIRRKVADSYGIHKAVREAFEAEYFYDDEYGTEISDVSADDVEFDEFYVLQVAGGSAVLEANATIMFSARVTGEIPSTRRNYKDGDYNARELRHEELKSSKKATVTFEVEYDTNDPNAITLVGVTLSGFSPAIDIDSLIN